MHVKEIKISPFARESKTRNQGKITRCLGKVTVMHMLISKLRKGPLNAF